MLAGWCRRRERGPAAGPARYREESPQGPRPDSRLLPARGGGFIQGYNCQDAAAGDRLMPGGYACQDTNDVLRAQRLAAVTGKGAAVVAAAHAAHAGDPAALAHCRARPCTLPEKEQHAPVMTSPPAITP